MFVCNFQTNMGYSKEVKLKEFSPKFVKISNCGAITSFNDEKEGDHEGARALNLPIRSRTPYPLGHAASHVKATILNALHFVKKKKTIQFLKIFIWNLWKPCQIWGKP